MSRLVEQIRQAVAAFVGLKAKPALIGGLALAAHQVVRATRDVDFLVDADDADRLHAILLSLGYRCVHRSEDAANYVRDDEGLDLLFAHRPVARRLLAEAADRTTGMGELRVISAEGLIGFKLQALINNPSRMRDLEDIRALLRAQHGRINMSEVREYFCLSGRNCWMSYSPKSTATKGDEVRKPLAGANVLETAHLGRGDLSDWADLMEAVEALCPIWPAAERAVGEGHRL